MATFEHYALVIPAGFFQLSFIHTFTGLPDSLICTIGCNGIGAGMTQAELDGVRDAWYDEIADRFSTATTFERVTARDGGGVVLESLDGRQGLSATAFASLNTAILIEKRTGTSGRRNRGRIYVPGLEESIVDQAGFLTSGGITAWQNAIDAFVTATEGVHVTTWEILHSKGWDGAVEPIDPGNAPPPTTITNWVVKSQVGTQRRRLR